MSSFAAVKRAAASAGLSSVSLITSDRSAGETDRFAAGTVIAI